MGRRLAGRDHPHRFLSQGLRRDHGVAFHEAALLGWVKEDAEHIAHQIELEG